MDHTGCMERENALRDAHRQAMSKMQRDVDAWARLGNLIAIRLLYPSQKRKVIRIDELRALAEEAGAPT